MMLIEELRVELPGQQEQVADMAQRVGDERAENGNGTFSPPTVTTQFRRYENALSTDFTDSADWNVRKTGMVQDVSQKLQDEWEFFTTNRVF